MRTRTPVLLVALALVTPGALARGDLRVSLHELEEDATLWSFARAPEESALLGCALLWMTASNDFPAKGELSLACYAEGRFERRVLEASPESLRDLRVEEGPEGALRVLLAHEDRIEERLLDSPEGTLTEARVLLRAEGLTRGALGSRPDFDGDGTRDLQLDTWRGVESWRRAADAYEQLSEARLPPRASMSRFGPDLTISGWDVTADEEPVTRWTSPQTRQGKRLSTWKIPLSEGRFGEPCEAWVQTPEPMAVQTRRFAQLGERDLLFAITQPSERFSLFGEGALIIAEPLCDETRRGRLPLLVADTSYAPWFPPQIRELEDVTGDGLADVVLLGFSGKLNVNAEVRVHEGLAGGGFNRRAIKWEEDADAVRLEWEADLDGDGYDDLLLFDAGKLVVYRGLAPRKGRVPLTNKASWRARLPRKWEVTWQRSWQIDEGGRSVILAWLAHEDDERRAFALAEVPLARD